MIRNPNFTLLLLGMTVAIFGGAALADPPAEESKKGPPLSGPERKRDKDRDSKKNADGQAAPDAGSQESASPERPFDGPRRRPGDRLRDRRGGPGHDRDMPPPDGEAFDGPPPEEGGPMDPERGPFRDGPRPRWPLTEEQIEEIRDLLREHFPEKYARFEEMRQDHPEMFERGLQRFAHMLRPILEAEPAVRELPIQDEKLKQQIDETQRRFDRTLRPEVRKELRQSLRSLIEQQFDVRMRRHEKMIEHMEERLLNVKAQREERLKHRDRLIDQQLDRMTGEERTPSWPE